MSKVYVITGASGFVGTNLIRKLCESKSDIKIIAISNHHDLFIKDKRIVEIKADIRDITSLEPIFNEYKNKDAICIHCASLISTKTEMFKAIYDINVTGTKNIIKMCLRHNFSKLIYISTVEILTDNISHNLVVEQSYFDSDKLNGSYAKTKAIATQCVIDASKKGLNTVILYPSAIIGPYDYSNGLITTYLRKYFQHNIPFLINGGYDFVDVRDVVNGILLSIQKGCIGNGYILSNQYLTFKELINRVNLINKTNNKIIIIPDWLINIFVKVINIFPNKNMPLLTSYSLNVIRKQTIYSNSKAKKVINYKPRDINETLRDTIKWLNK